MFHHLKVGLRAAGLDIDQARRPRRRREVSLAPLVVGLEDRRLPSGAGAAHAAAATADRFVIGQYQSILQRSPQPAGVDYWVSELRGGLSRTEVHDLIESSPEHQSMLGSGSGSTGAMVAVAHHHKAHARVSHAGARTSIGRIGAGTTTTGTTGLGTTGTGTTGTGLGTTTGTGLGTTGTGLGTTTGTGTTGLGTIGAGTTTGTGVGLGAGTGSTGTGTTGAGSGILTSGTGTTGMGPTGAIGMGPTGTGVGTGTTVAGTGSTII